MSDYGQYYKYNLKLKALARWAKDTATPEWREAALDPDKFEDKISEASCPDGRKLNQRERRYCLGWVKLAWERFNNQGQGPFLDQELCCAIQRAVDEFADRAG